MNKSTLAITIIEPKKGWVPIDLKEIWKHREFPHFIIKRDFRARNNQTVHAGLHAIIQSAFNIIVFTHFLRRLVKIPSERISHPIFVYAVLLPWMNLSNSGELVSFGMSATMIFLLISTGIYYFVRMDKVCVDVV